MKLKHTLLYITKKVNSLRLKNKTFSLLCNSCIGGVIYNRTGVRFNSPTINMGMADKDFLKFLHNLKYYLSCELTVYDDSPEAPHHFDAKLGDLSFFFGHYNTKEEVLQKWEERKKRINWDNLFVIMSDRPNGGDETKITKKDILSLQNIGCRGLAVFSTKDFDDIDYIVNLPKDKKGDYVNQYMYDKIKFLDMWRWEFKFDYVHWLNSGQVKK